MPRASDRFSFLKGLDDRLAEYGALAEALLEDGYPGQCLAQCRKFSERMAKLVANNIGLRRIEREKIFDLLKRLENEDFLPRDVLKDFHHLRTRGNTESHDDDDAQDPTAEDAIAAIKRACALSVWFHKEFRNPTRRKRKPHIKEPRRARWANSEIIQGKFYYPFQKILAVAFVCGVAIFGLIIANSFDRSGTVRPKRDFTRDPSVIVAQPGLYVLAGGIQPSPRSTAYSILYFARDKSFVVTLLQRPLGLHRSEAEQRLIELLDANKSTMCSLNYLVGVPSFVDSALAGKNLGFSFCPGATSL